MPAAYQGDVSAQQAIDAAVRSVNRTLLLVSGGERAGDAVWQRDHDESLRFVGQLREILGKNQS